MQATESSKERVQTYERELAMVDSDEISFGSLLQDILIVNDGDWLEEEDDKSNSKEVMLHTGSQSTPSKFEVAVEAVHNDDIIEFKKCLGLRGSLSSVETSIACVPPLHVVATETSGIRKQRTLLLKCQSFSDKWISVAKEIVHSKFCNLFRFEYNKVSCNKNDEAWSLEMFFCSSEAASSALNKLKQSHPDVLVSKGEDSFEAGSLGKDQNVLLEKEMGPWINLVFILKNIGVPSDSRREKLQLLFPNAEIAFHKDSGSELLKGLAYLVFGNKDQADSVVSKFRQGSMKLDGRRLILLRWNPVHVLPCGMLRLSERFLVMCRLREMEKKLEKLDSNTMYVKLNELVVRDTISRYECGFPAPSYDHLLGLGDVRRFSEKDEEKILRRLLSSASAISTDSSTQNLVRNDKAIKSSVPGDCELAKCERSGRTKEVLPDSVKKRPTVIAASSRRSDSGGSAQNEILTTDNIKSKFTLSAFDARGRKRTNASSELNVNSNKFYCAEVVKKPRAKVQFHPNFVVGSNKSDNERAGTKFTSPYFETRHLAASPKFNNGIWQPYCRPEAARLLQQDSKVCTVNGGTLGMSSRFMRPRGFSYVRRAPNWPKEAGCRYVNYRHGNARVSTADYSSGSFSNWNNHAGSGYQNGSNYSPFVPNHSRRIGACGTRGVLRDPISCRREFANRNVGWNDDFRCREKTFSSEACRDERTPDGGAEAVLLRHVLSLIKKYKDMSHYEYNIDGKSYARGDAATDFGSRLPTSRMKCQNLKAASSPHDYNYATQVSMQESALVMGLHSRDEPGGYFSTRRQGCGNHWWPRPRDSCRQSFQY